MPDIPFKETLMTVGTYALLILLAFFACCAVASVLKFLLRFIFRQIRFVICLVIVVILLGSFLIKSAVAPVRQTMESSGITEIMDSAVEQFKGFYSKTLPLLAWRFTDVTDETAAQEDYFEPDEAPSSQEADEKTVRIRVDYLPAGSIVLSYDRETGAFSIEKPLKED